MPVQTEKLQKVLARAGLGSRREIECWIRDKQVTINGHLATLGNRVGAKDSIKVNGKLVRVLALPKQKPRVLLYHKPEGEICTRKDTQGRATVFEKLPPLKAQRWIMIGRLDLNTSGLLLFTNEGELAHRLLHPSYEIEREYAVRVSARVSPEVLKRLQSGVKLEDGPAAFTRIREMRGTPSNQWYHVVLKEGRQREVRRLWESQHVKVSRLRRIRFGNIVLPSNLPRGEWRELPAEKIKALFASVSKKARQ